MAKIFAPPTELPAPEPDYKNYDFEKEEARAEAWLLALSAYCREHGNGATAGKEVSVGRGDGYARYMVFKEKPLQLIHIPLFDAWRADAIWERGLRLKDVRENIAGREGIKALFAKKN